MPTGMALLRVRRITSARGKVPFRQWRDPFKIGHTPAPTTRVAGRQVGGQKIFEIFHVMPKKQKTPKNRTRKQSNRRVNVEKPRPILVRSTNQKRRGAVVKNTPGRFVFSECLKRFCCALSNPWADGALGVCLPIEPVRDSYKVRVRAYGTAMCGTFGLGYVAISPSLANNNFSYYYTSNSYTSSNTIVLALSADNTVSTTGVVGGIFSNLPFTNDQLRSDTTTRGMSGRIVSVGVKCSHTGPMLTRQGTWVTMVTSDHSDLVNIALPNALESLGTSIHGIDRDTVQIVAGPVDQPEYEYSSPIQLAVQQAACPTYPWSPFTALGVERAAASIYLNGAVPIVIAITGGEVGQPFTFDIVAHYEFSGRKVPNTTKSHSDELAAKAAMKASGETNAVGRNATTQSLLQNVKNTLLSQSGNMMGFAARKASDLTVDAATRYLSRLELDPRYGLN